MTRIHRLTAPAAALLMALLMALPGAANAATIQQQIDRHLKAYPGGTQTSPTEISYAGGTFIVTFTRPPGIMAGPDCPSGWFCFYDQPSYGYPRGKLSSCGWQDLSQYGWHDRTDSVYTAQSYGLVQFLNHADGTSHSNDYPLFSIEAAPGKRGIADVWPLQNMADHVKRWC